MSSAPAAPSTDEPVDCALALAACGVRVLPIRPGFKYPPMKSWQHAATNDVTSITNWYRGLYRGHGVGLAMGPQPCGKNIVAIDVDVHDPTRDGREALADLEHEHGKLPDTWRSLTGSDGAHIFLAVPANAVVRNQQAGGNRIAPGIDVRGDGGQVVVAPTVHPDTQRPYAWEHGYAPWEIQIADCPAWLLELIVERVASPAPAPDPWSQPSNTSTDSIAESVREWFDWHHELTARGWTSHHTDGGDTYWTRPGKDKRQGHSAVQHNDTHLVIFTTSIDESWKQSGVLTRDGSGYSFSPFGFIAAADHGGDRSAAARALRAAQAPATGTHAPAVAPVEPDDYDAVLRAMLIDWPTFWNQDHGDAEWIAEPIIPAKRSVALFAPGGTGKSLLALWLSAHLAAGTDPFSKRQIEPVDVLYLDYEMTNDDLAERLAQMGFDGTVLERLHYALLPSLPGLDQPEGGKAVVRLAELVDAELVVVDTFGRAVHGDENEADTVRAWYRWTGLHLKHAGRAFLRVDHAGKDLAKGQRGTSAKNDDVDVVWQMTRKEDGAYTLTAKKRRMGWVPETVNLTMVDDDLLTFGLLSGNTYPAGTKEMAKVLDDLAVDLATSATKACRALREAGRKGRNEVVRAAQKYRQERSSTLHFVGDDPESEAPKTAPQKSGRGPSENAPGAVRGAVDAEPTNPQLDESGRGAGRGGAGVVAEGGARRRSIERARSTAAPNEPETPEVDPGPAPQPFAPF